MDMFDRTRDAAVRNVAFDWLRAQVDQHGDVLPRTLLAAGFTLQGVRVPLLGPQGIFKPKVLSAAPRSRGARHPPGRPAAHGVSRTVPQQARYRDPDAIQGGTWDAFERVLKRRGCFTTGLRKVEAARQVAAHFDPDRNRSHSFDKLRAVIAEAAG